eukprot:TRINITY_DN370_c2_g3_i1.p1 TRINITY_DN370_c2_g3~~TRINITY_DN370_c2_g3_i1.p1  ORF type:complete len:471 (+),score=111.44 TRINITY_DN370_c2_g3_i1:117-1529(+)
MAAPFPAPVSAVQVGSYFVTQYYQILQQQPDFVHQFYTDASTAIHVDGEKIKMATGMMQIHAHIMCLNFTGIEIKTVQSLDSWSGGILVMISGAVQGKDFNGWRKFAQTFFLAPQEKGYFLLNDIFQFLVEEQIHLHPAAIVDNGDFDSKNASNPLPDSVSDYTLGGEIETREFLLSSHVEENDPVDKYSLPEAEQLVSEADDLVEEIPAEEESSTASFPVTVNTVQDSPVTDSVPGAMSTIRDPPPAPVEESVGETTKQTYASILRVAKEPVPLVACQASLNKRTPVVSELHPSPQPTSQHPYPASVEAVEEVVTPEEEGDGRSVYVGNLSSTVSVSDVEQEFKNFGKISPDGVVVRNRKDIGVCYAFIEFEDAVSVQNAIKASPIQLCGRQVHIEERRANNNVSRGGRRGRGRGGYQTEAPRGGRSGPRTFGRGSGQDSGDREYNSRPRANGFHQRDPRQERGILGTY